MLVRDLMVSVHRATEDDAHGIATLHAEAERKLLQVSRGRADARALSIEQDERIWRDDLRLSSGDHRPWIAWRGDRAVGFVTAGPSRDQVAAPGVGELYVLDLGDDATRSVANSLVEHACHDLSLHGFSEVTVWVASRDIVTRELLGGAGWCADGSRRFERVRGIPILEFRYRRSLG